LRKISKFLNDCAEKEEKERLKQEKNALKNSKMAVSGGIGSVPITPVSSPRLSPKMNGRCVKDSRNLDSIRRRRIDRLETMGKPAGSEDGTIENGTIVGMNQPSGRIGSRIAKEGV